MSSILGREDPLEEQMAAHFSMCLGNAMDGGAWRAAVHGVVKSQEGLSAEAVRTC